MGAKSKLRLLHMGPVPVALPLPTFFGMSVVLLNSKIAAHALICFNSLTIAHRVQFLAVTHGVVAIKS